MVSPPLRILGPRVLVAPDVNLNAPTEHGSIVLAKTLAAAVVGEDATISAFRGTVVAVGRARHALYDEVMSLAGKLHHDRGEHAKDAARLLEDLVRPALSVSLGDDVLFSHDAGQEIVVDGTTYLILGLDELLAVLT